MAYNLSQLNVASLDFSEIKSSLISFLKEQPDLKDLDFDNSASATNMLVNILSTATAYNGVYAQYGYLNSFATTATTLPSILGIAANSSVLVEPTKCSKTTRTVTVSGTTLTAYSTFTALNPNGTQVIFYNVESVGANTTDSIAFYCGSVETFTEFDYNTFSMPIPYYIDPETITLQVTNTNTGSTINWTKVDSISKVPLGNQTHYSVINGNLGYLVTTNIPTAQIVTTDSKVTVSGIRSTGSVGNNSIINGRTNATFNTYALPTGGVDVITVNKAKTQLRFKSTGQERCVTVNDYKNAILNSGIDGTETESKISVSSGSTPGQVKVYVQDLSSSYQTTLLDYLYEKSLVGINLVYSL
jgi:hypothetical protein